MSMPPHVWENKFDTDDDVTHLFYSNKDVLNHNHKMLLKTNHPIVLIEAENTGNARNMSGDHLMGLQCKLSLSVDAKVVITSNMAECLGLVNGTVGVVKDIVYADSARTPGQPDCVWVDIGDRYRGPSFFPADDERRRSWVPIFPIVARTWSVKSSVSRSRSSEDSLYDVHTRTMLPLRLAWAWTIHKAQGQTITGKIVIDLGDKEMCHGLTYVAFSRATRLDNIGIIGGLSRERFLDKINGHRAASPEGCRTNAPQESPRVSGKTLPDCFSAIAFCYLAPLL
jgi:hypothetical protein